MADNVRALVIKSGTQQQIPAADSLLVGSGIDASAVGPLSIGGTTANAITIGSAAITTDFPGPVQLTGDVTTVGGTTFTSDATFEGNVTFGNGPSDTVTFASTTTIINDIAFNGAGYRVTNMLDPTGPSTQEGATAAWVTSQIGALVTGVSAVSATAPLLSSGGSTPDISIDTAGAANGDVLTFNAGAWAAAAPVTTPPGGAVDNVQLNDGAGGFAGSASLSFAASTLTVQSTVAVTDGSETLSLSKDSASTDAATLDIEAASSVTATITGGATYLLTPDSIDALTYAASVAIDLDPSLPPLKSVALTGDITFTTSSVAAARNVSVRVIGDTVSRNLVFPAGWTWLGGAAPTVLEANKVAILSIAAFGATDSTIVASWSYDGSDVVTDVTASAPLASSGGATPDISLTGVIDVANGGTGVATITAGSLVVGDGANAVNEIAPGANGEVLTVVGGAWASQAVPAAVDYSVVSITTAVAQGDAVTVAGAAALATAAASARVAGMVSATANKVSVLGIVEDCNFEGSLTLAVGEAVYLSASSAGKLTNVAPSGLVPGQIVAELGIIVIVNTAGGGAAAADVLWQPKSIVVL